MYKSSKRESGRHDREAKEGRRSGGRKARTRFVPAFIQKPAGLQWQTKSQEGINVAPSPKRDQGAIEEEERQYAIGGHTLEELDEKYPNRPRNHARTLFFVDLCQGFFEPLSANKKQPSKLKGRRTNQVTPHEYRRRTIERFISKWRTEVGNDFFPALRLMLPSSDRERGVYGVKESAIARLLIKLMGIDKNSEDAQSILKWKQPNQSTMAGDFVDRCYLVLSKRSMRVEPGDMRLADVNEMLDRLAAATGEKQQLPIFETFYQRMNAEELRWLLRIILKQMRIGATEKTIIELWHPDGQSLFDVSSSLRRVCWDLYDPKLRLTGEQTGVALMQCFHPQLAHWEMAASFDIIVERLNASAQGTASNNKEYWIEEKLDGERMQLHMLEDESIPGGKRFHFWSRRGTDYTYLYGQGLQDEENSSLTRHLKNAFAPGVRNIILDGEMLVWDPLLKKVLRFGTLKSAALEGAWNPHGRNAPQPVFIVYDIVFLNDQPLTQYTLRDRRNALTKAVPGVPKRLEVHKHTAATSPDEIEPMLRKIVSDSSEGLVLKNPNSMYSVGQRPSDWIKVKPDYMDGFGENVDVVIIGGYYGSGRRGGRLSSFLCGLRVTESDIQAGAHPEKCYSFIKVGGGFSAEDYAEIQHLTQGKWKDWDVKKPPTQFIQLAGGEKYQYERPDVWIRPSESVVITVKAASSEETTSMASRLTLRFPRFKSRRPDKSWDQALDYEQFEELVAAGKKTQEFKMEKKRRHVSKRAKKEIVIVGEDRGPVVFAGPKTKVFDGLEFCILSDCTKPAKKSKAQLEALVKENGGKISQRANPAGMIIVAEKKVVKVASLIKAGEVDIIHPRWLLDCVSQGPEGFLLPYEPEHLFHATDATRAAAEKNTDEYGDSFARNLDVQELRQLLRNMPKAEARGTQFDTETFIQQLSEHGHELGDMRSRLFRGMAIYLAGVYGVPPIQTSQVRNWIRFANGRVVEDSNDRSITHCVILSRSETEERQTAVEVRTETSSWRPLPRIVSSRWVADCWKNRTILDEERYSSL
ncbi:DNA ligase I [Xylariaceae sp. FL0594]|nr:DNA ligase I [Xylariaceae sp. FL0594]